MNKKILLSIGIISLTFTTVFGQCTPDPSYINPGFYPDSLTGLADAHVGIPFDEVLTIITPIDTVVLIGPFPVTLTFDSLVVTDVLGLPPGFSYSCLTENCAIPGGISSCLSFYGTSMLSDVGTYPIIIEYDIFLGGNGTPDIVSANDDYTINVINSVGMDNLNRPSFDLQQNIPNPCNQSTTIGFSTDKFGDYSFIVMNSLGEIVHKERITVNKIENSIELDISNYCNGLYFYSLASKEIHLTRKMIVN
ncbi:MAG: T9SS type A sorting domain-containing protein [Bacteroidetes bacterium]|nr:T9SS type A sorting domain-containing protein [Bacteroidota bacterium]